MRKLFSIKWKRQETGSKIERIGEEEDFELAQARLLASTSSNVLREFNECFPDCILSITPGDTQELIKRLEVHEIGSRYRGRTWTDKRQFLPSSFF